MDANARAELASIKGELSSIINELESISNGIRHDFAGIGNEQCADCIDNVINQYRYVMRKLNNMDTSKLTESFAKVQAAQVAAKAAQSAAQVAAQASVPSMTAAHGVVEAANRAVSVINKVTKF